MKHLASRGIESEALLQYARADELASVAYGGRFLPTPVFISAQDIVDTLFAECAEHLETAGRPVVALADWPESFRTYEPRLKVMATLLDGLGIDALPCHVGQIRKRSGRLEAHGRVIDVVYRFFLVEEIVNEDDGRLVEPILQAVEEGSVGLFSRLDAELYGNKGTLALLSDDRHRSVFSVQEQACIDRFLPWTRFVRPTATEADGREIDLMRHALDRQQDLIIKPTLLHGDTASFRAGP